MPISIEQWLYVRNRPKARWNKQEKRTRTRIVNLGGSPKNRFPEVEVHLPAVAVPGRFGKPPVEIESVTCRRRRSAHTGCVRGIRNASRNAPGPRTRTRISRGFAPKICKIYRRCASRNKKRPIRSNPTGTAAPRQYPLGIVPRKPRSSFLVVPRSRFADRRPRLLLMEGKKKPRFSPHVSRSKKCVRASDDLISAGCDSIAVPWRFRAP